MLCRGLVVAGVVWLVMGSVAKAQGEKKAPVPVGEANVRAAKLIQELYQGEMDKAAKDPAAKGRLAITLLQEARDTNDDLAGKYVLLVLAGRFASQVGDAGTALQAIEEMGQHFAIPASEILQAKIGALLDASKSFSSNDAYQNMIDSSLVLLEDALAEDDFPSSNKLLEAAENAARKLRNVSLVASIRKRQEEVQKLEKEFARWRPFADKLAQNPDDAQANLEMGVYQAFLKGNWERGLVHLAKGSNAELKTLAVLERSDPQEASKQIELAGKWFAEAEKLKDGMRSQVLLHSYHWYQQALGDLEAKTREQVEQRMQKIMELLPAEYRIGEITTELKKIEGHLGAVYCAAFSPDAKKIISAGADGSLRLWDARTGKELRRLDGHTGRVWAVAFAPDGRRVVSGGFDGSVRLWDLASGREIRRFAGHSDYVRSVAMSRDGQYILSGGDDRLIRLWSVETGKEVRSFYGHEHYVWSVALSRDGKRVLSASLDKTARVWDISTGREVRVLRGHQDTVLSAALTPDGRRGLTGSTDRTLIFWDLESAKDLGHAYGHTGYVNSVDLSPDGRRGLSGSQDNTIRLWDVYTGKELRKLEGHREQVWHVAFSSDGRLALSCSQDGTLRLWGGAR
jgi:hypothetical protein